MSKHSKADPDGPVDKNPPEIFSKGATVQNQHLETRLMGEGSWMVKPEWG